MLFLVILFGLLSGTLLSVFVGLVGRGRRIGFGWAFIFSLVFTPFVGLILALLSEPLTGAQQRWGCLSFVLGFLSFLFLIAVLLMIFTGGAALYLLL